MEKYNQKNKELDKKQNIYDKHNQSRQSQITQESDYIQPQRKLSLQNHLQDLNKKSTVIKTNKSRRYTNMENKAEKYLEVLRQAGKQKKKQQQDLKALAQQLKQNQQKPFNQNNYTNFSNSGSQTLDDFQFPNQNMFLQEQVQIDKKPSIQNIRYDPNDIQVAVASDDGFVRIYNEYKGSFRCSIMDQTSCESACTSIRWLPMGNASQILATYQNGSVIMFNAQNGETKNIYEKGIANYQSPTKKHQNKNEIVLIQDVSQCDFNSTGEKFSTVGYDQEVRIYDSGTGKCNILGKEGSKHQNRIYAVKFLPDESNVLMTAGWDNTILFWDARMEKSINFIYGPEICGDSLDFCNNKILAGSWRSKDQLQLYDYRTMTLEQTIPWNSHNSNNDLSQKNYIYSCKFSKNNHHYILAGSVGTHELRLFDRTQGNKCVDCIKDRWDKGIYSLDFANNKDSVVYGCANGIWGNLNLL